MMLLLVVQGWSGSQVVGVNVGPPACSHASLALTAAAECTAAGTLIKDGWGRSEVC